MLRRCVLLFVTLLTVDAAAWDEGLVLTTDYSALGWARSVRLEAPWTVSGDLVSIGRLDDETGEPRIAAVIPGENSPAAGMKGAHKCD